MKIDGKGRVSVPPDFRRALEAADPEYGEGRAATVFISHMPGEAFLDCMTVDHVDELTEKVESMHDGDPDREALEEYLYEKVASIQLDGTHRITLSRDLREAIGLDGEVLFAGRGKRFRIFSPDAPDVAVSRLAQRMEGLPKGSSPLRLLPGETA